MITTSRRWGFFPPLRFVMDLGLLEDVGLLFFFSECRRKRKERWKMASMSDLERWVLAVEEPGFAMNRCSHLQSDELGINSPSGAPSPRRHHRALAQGARKQIQLRKNDLSEMLRESPSLSPHPPLPYHLFRPKSTFTHANPPQKTNSFAKPNSKK